MEVLYAAEPIPELGMIPGDRVYLYDDDARIVRRITRADVEKIRDRLTTPPANDDDATTRES